MPTTRNVHRHCPIRHRSNVRTVQSFNSQTYLRKRIMELHDMKQSLALIFAARRVGCAERTPPVVADGSSLQSVALVTMLHKISTQGGSVVSWAGLLTPRRLSLLSSL